ncbi:MAG: alpha/beta fold hydrolase [Gemmatimonadota bacterium]
MTGSRAQERLADESDAAVERRVADLSVLVAGRGRDLLLLHGLSANRTEWHSLVPRLADDFRLVAPDLAGRGSSPAGPRDRFRLADEVDRLAALVDELGLRRPIVVGHSHGGALAVALASIRECSALLLLNPISPWTRRPPALTLLSLSIVRRVLGPVVRHYRRPLTRYILTRRVYADPRAATEETIRRYAGGVDTSEKIDALLRVVADWRPSELGAYDLPSGTPVRLVTGRHDRRATPEDVARWASRLGGPLEVLEDCAHGVPEEAPDRVVQMILELDGTRHPGRTDSL